MALHFTIMVVLLLCANIGKRYSYNNKLLIGVSFIIFFALAAFRGINIGNDTLEYYRVFQLISRQTSLSAAYAVTRYEYGYVLLNYVISRFTDSFTWILAITSGVYLLSVYRYIQKNTKSIEKAIVLFFTFSMYYSVMNIGRQCIAIAIMLWAFSFLEKRQYIRYCLLIVIASQFHTMSILFIVLCVVPRINFSDKLQTLRLFIISLVFLVVLNYGISFILPYFPYLGHYVTSSMYSTGGIRVASVAFCAIRLITVGLLFLVGGFEYQREDMSEKTNLLNKLMLIDCVIAVASIGFNMYDRIEFYVRIGFIVAVVNAIELLSNKGNKTIIYGVVFVSSFLYLTASIIFRSDWSGIFPYSFIWNS